LLRYARNDSDIGAGSSVHPIALKVIAVELDNRRTREYDSWGIAGRNVAMTTMTHLWPLRVASGDDRWRTHGPVEQTS
jgi:hypothetical protein